MPVFEFIVIQRPTKKESEDGQLEKLIVGPKVIVAKDIESVKTRAIATSNLEAVADLDRVVVLARPFV